MSRAAQCLTVARALIDKQSNGTTISCVHVIVGCYAAPYLLPFRMSKPILSVLLQTSESPAYHQCSPCLSLHWKVSGALDCLSKLRLSESVGLSC